MPTPSNLRPEQHWTVSIIDWHTNSSELRKIRAEVFIEEQNVPLEEEWDGLDEKAIHLLAKAADGTAVGTARLLPNGQVGRMAVLKPYRKSGVGAALLKYIISWNQSQPRPPLFLHAQVHAIPFYQKLGFIAEGPEFMDANIAHREMRRPS